MAGDNEATLFATGHVEAKLLLRRQSEELGGETSHFGDEFLIDAVINNLKNTPILASLDDFLANALSAAMDVVDSGERNNGDLVAELVVGNLGALVLIPDEAGFQRLLLREVRESLGCGSHDGEMSLVC